MGLKTRTVKGIGWSVTSQAVRLLLNLGITAVLARLLSPDDFGLIAMVVVFTNLFLILNDLGLPAAVIHKQGLTEEHLSSAFWINLLEGLVLALILCLAAPFIAHFFSKSVLLPMILVLSSTLFISSIGMLQQALMSKALDFRLLAIIEIAATLLSGITAITLAALGFGVWSLVLQAVALSIFTAIPLLVLCTWKPRFLFRWKPTRELLGYGLPLMGFGFVNYFSRNLDNLLIGKYLGAIRLGFYSMAYRLMLFPLGNVSSVIGRVMFPALSTIQDDLEKVRGAYIRANRYISAMTFPLIAGLIVMAPAFVKVLLGSKWVQAIPLIQILAVVGLLQSLGTTVGWIYQSQGRTGIMLLWGIGATISYATAFVIGLHWGVTGVATAYLIAVVLILYPSFAIPFRLIGLKFRTFLRYLSSVILATAGMASVLVGMRYLMEGLHAGDLAVLATLVPLGIAVYLGIIVLIDRPLLVGLIETFRELRAKQEPPEVFDG